MRQEFPLWIEISGEINALSNLFFRKVTLERCIAVADPGFAQRGAPTLRWGRQDKKLLNFPPKLHETEKTLVAGGGGGVRREYPPWIRHCIEYVGVKLSWNTEKVFRALGSFQNISGLWS